MKTHQYNRSSFCYLLLITNKKPKPRYKPYLHGKFTNTSIASRSIQLVSRIMMMLNMYDSFDSNISISLTIIKLVVLMNIYILSIEHVFSQLKFMRGVCGYNMREEIPEFCLLLKCNGGIRNILELIYTQIENKD